MLGAGDLVFAPGAWAAAVAVLDEDVAAADVGGLGRRLRALPLGLLRVHIEEVRHARRPAGLGLPALGQRRHLGHPAILRDDMQLIYVQVYSIPLFTAGEPAEMMFVVYKITSNGTSGKGN